jgi:S1-C subfamily serine protease
VDDAAVDAAIKKQGVALMNKGQTIPIETLRQQLKRTHFDLTKLPTLAKKPLAPARAYLDSRDSTVIIGGLYMCTKCDQWHCSVAAGFPIAEPDIFVSNYHVFAGTNNETMVGMNFQRQVQPVTEILAASRAQDIAIFRIPGLKARPLALRDEAPVGSAVSLVSHPDMHYFAYSQGAISRYSRQARPGGRDKVVLEITADFAKGSSGAPILDECGNAVGMVALTRAVFHDNEAYQSVQMVFKECVPASAIHALITPSTTAVPSRK